MLWAECLCPPQNSQVEVLAPNMMVFEVETLEGDQVYMRSEGWDPHDGISTFMR